MHQSESDFRSDEKTAFAPFIEIAEITERSRTIYVDESGNRVRAPSKVYLSRNREQSIVDGLVSGGYAGKM